MVLLRLPAVLQTLKWNPTLILVQAEFECETWPWNEFREENSLQGPFFNMNHKMLTSGHINDKFLNNFGWMLKLRAQDLCNQNPELSKHNKMLNSIEEFRVQYLRILNGTRTEHYGVIHQYSIKGCCRRQKGN